MYAAIATLETVSICNAHRSEYIAFRFPERKDNQSQRLHESHRVALSISGPPFMSKQKRRADIYGMCEGGVLWVVGRTRSSPE